jgi:hypothetical protein
MTNRHINIGYAAQTVAASARRSFKHVKLAHEPQPWQTQASAAYQHAQRQSISMLPRLLGARIHTLTGHVIARESIFVDPHTQIATAVVDGVVFRAHDRQVFLLRSCAECGLGHFESPPLATRADLGHALDVWQPRHGACQPEDPTNWLDS